MLQKEQLAGESVCVRIVPSSNQLVIGKDKSFTFDHVLPSKVTQVNCLNCLIVLLLHCYINLESLCYVEFACNSKAMQTRDGHET